MSVARGGDSDTHRGYSDGVWTRTCVDIKLCLSEPKSLAHLPFQFFWFFYFKKSAVKKKSYYES